MNKALRFVWLSLLTLICGVASAGTVVFDPTTDSGGGKSITKNGITLEIYSGSSTLEPTTKDGTTSFLINGKFRLTTDGVTGNMTKVTIYYLSGSFLTSYDNVSSYDVTDKQTGISGYCFTTYSSDGLNSIRFSTYSNNSYLPKIVVEYIGEDPDDGTTNIDKLFSGKKDVAGAKIKFTNAQVVYKEDNGGTYNYIVREGGKALDLMGTALNFDLGATLNGTVTMDVTYNSGILKATDAAETSDADLTKSGSSDKYLPVKTTLANLANNAGDLVYLEKVTLYQDTYNDFGNGTDAFYFKSGYKCAYISNYEEVKDKLADASGTYLVTAWYNAYGTATAPASLKVIDAQMPLSAPVITATEESFLESTTVTITATDGATIYYTLDNSTPQSAWGTTYTYTVPFTINQTTTVKAVAVKDGVTSDVTEKTFTGPSTIADLYNNAQSQTNVLLKLTDAKVVYADGNGNYILRENGKALDVLNTSLDLKQGTVLNGTVQLNVNYTYGIISTSDIDGTTNADKLTVTGEESTELDPIACTSVTDIRNHPGDLVSFENWYFYTYYFYDSSYNIFYISNSSSAGLTTYQYSDCVVWYNELRNGYSAYGKVVEGNKHITSLDAPTIEGTTLFANQTTVTITSDESVAKIYYTINGDEPTTASTPYTEPFTLTESATVKAIAVYKKVVSEVASKEFTKLDLTTPKTIAELNELATSLDEATVRFENAQVVYAEGTEGNYNYVVRENNQAIDLVGTSLNLTQGKTLTGTVKVNVTYNNGLLTTADIAGETTDAELTQSGEASDEPLPLTCEIKEVYKHPGDLIKLDRFSAYNSDGFYTNDWGYDDNNEWRGFNVYFANGEEKGLVTNKVYTATFWFNELKGTDPLVKLLDVERTTTYLNMPSISGDEVFQGEQKVELSLYGDDDIATLYYTLDGSEPSADNGTKYEAPFTIDKSVTVKAIAVWKDLKSSVTTKEFTYVSPDEPLTITEIAALKASLKTVTVRLENALVVYGEDNNYILRDNGRALDVLNTGLQLTVGSTLTGTVKFQIEYTDYYKGGILTTVDLSETNADKLQVTPGETTLPSPLAVTFSEVPTHPGDLLCVQDAKCQYYSWSYEYVFYTDTPEWAMTYLSNASDYTLTDGDTYDAVIWYTGLTSGGAMQAKIVGLKQTLDYTITSAGWGTLILPFSTEKPAGMDVYECTGVQKDANTGVGTLQLEEASCLMANTPYIVKGTEGVEMPFSLEGYAGKQTQEQYSNGVMTGVLSALTAPTGSYVLQNQPDVDGVAFYIVLASQNFTMTPYRCYINAQNDPTLRAIRFPGTDTNSIYGATAANGFVDVFTTTGVKVKNQVERAHALDGLTAGVYIINNQKIIKK